MAVGEVGEEEAKVFQHFQNTMQGDRFYFRAIAFLLDRN